MRIRPLLAALLLALFTAGCDSGSNLFGDPAHSDGGVDEADPNHCKATDFTCVRRAASLAVAELGTPFDPNIQDQMSGPDDGAPQYGTAPQYFAHINDDRTIDLLWLVAVQGSRKVIQFRLRPTPPGYTVAAALELTSAGKVLGFTKDEKKGLFYFVTSIDEDLSIKLEPTKLHRPNIVKMIQYGIDGKIRKSWDLGVLRGQQYPDSLPLYSPMNFSTSRALFGGGKVATLFAVNTEVDMSIMRRHQMARYMELDVASDHIDREAGIWVSHSFEQRLLFDGTGFIELHLGDAFPRDVVLARHVIGSPPGMPTNALGIKGKTGDNNTFSRLGGLARIDASTYLTLFITESTDGTDPVDGLMRVAGPRNLGLARVSIDAQAADESFGAPFTVTNTDGNGMATKVTDHVLWLTDSADPNVQVERPRIAHLDKDINVIIYERWVRQNGANFTFGGVHALEVDDSGVIHGQNDKLTHHNLRLPRSDDIYVVNSKAAWFTGDASKGTIYMQMLDGDLNLSTVTIQ